MKLPFNTQQFFEVFKTYNHAIWPLQLVFPLLAVVTIFIMIWKPIISGKNNSCNSCPFMDLDGWGVSYVIFFNNK